MKSMVENKLISNFKDKGSFSRTDLLNYFLRSEGEMKEGTLGWRIYDLKKKNILNEIKRGWYTLNTKPVYISAIDEKIINLAALFVQNYRNAKFCIWDINWLNEFTIHQFNREMMLIETEKDLQESLAHTLSDHKYPVLWSLKGTLLNVYQEMVIVLPLITRAPTQIVVKGKVSIELPTLEKILVDIFQDEKVFHFLQGAEMERIYENALNRYSINFSTLFTYAKRRGKENDIREFLNKNFSGNLMLNI